MRIHGLNRPEKKRAYGLKPTDAIQVRLRGATLPLPPLSPPFRQPASSASFMTLT
jgi:hypothetical protein